MEPLPSQEALRSATGSKQARDKTLTYFAQYVLGDWGSRQVTKISIREVSLSISGAGKTALPTEPQPLPNSQKRGKHTR